MSQLNHNAPQFWPQQSHRGSRGHRHGHTTYTPAPRAPPAGHTIPPWQPDATGAAAPSPLYRDNLRDPYGQAQGAHLRTSNRSSPEMGAAFGGHYDIPFTHRVALVHPHVAHRSSPPDGAATSAPSGDSPFDYRAAPAGTANSSSSSSSSSSSAPPPAHTDTATAGASLPSPNGHNVFFSPVRRFSSRTRGRDPGPDDGYDPADPDPLLLPAPAHAPSAAAANRAPAPPPPMQPAPPFPTSAAPALQHRRGGGGNGGPFRKCILCNTRFSTATSGPTAYAKHLSQRHAGAALTAEMAQALQGMVTQCACGRLFGALAVCPCLCREAAESRIPLPTGAVIRSTGIVHAAPVRSAAAHTAAALAVAIARADAELPTVAAMLAGDVSLESLAAVGTELDRWAGSETLVNIPVRARPLLAQTFGDLLAAMTGGSVKAGLLLKLFPKLILHRASLQLSGIGATAATIRRRCSLLLQGQIDDLFTTIKQERAAPVRVTNKRPRDSGAKAKTSMASVRALAQAGAYSKAIGRLTSSLAEYDATVALQWAIKLIPNPPAGAGDLGASATTDVDRARIRSIRTCADDIVAAPPPPPVPIAAPAAEAGEEEWQDEPPPERAPPSATAFAKGVHFSALTAPGPSGLRAEHIRAFAMSRNARARQAYERAMTAFVATAVRGDLPIDACWWLTDSSLTYAKKPGTGPDDAPRPLRVGETLRRFVAKRIAAAERQQMQRTFVKARQFGVACPGGAEILIHHRVLTREYASSSSREGLGEWDNDYKNCFGSIFWRAIDEGVERLVPGAFPWTRWCHNRKVRILVPGGGVHLADRGAEQGDPLGPMYAAAAIAMAVHVAAGHAMAMRRDLSAAQTRSSKDILAVVANLLTKLKTASAGHPGILHCYTAHEARTAAAVSTEAAAGIASAWDASAAATAPYSPAVDAPLRCFDTWYLDDSFIRGGLIDGDLWLAALDAVGSAAGLERSPLKSTFRAPAHNTPTPPYTAFTSRRQDWTEPMKCLGVGLTDVAVQLEAKIEQTAELHKALADLDDPAIELILIRQCVEVNRITHLLRAIGPTLPSAHGDGTPGRILCPGFEQLHLQKFDDVMRMAVTQTVRCHVTDEAAQQATWGVKGGGLGLRAASTIVLPAHVASLVEAEAMVQWLSDSSCAAGVPDTDGEITHVTRREAAVEALLSGIDPVDKASMESSIEKAVVRAKKLSDSITNPPNERPPPAPIRHPYTAGSAPSALVPDAGESAPSGPPSNRPQSSPRLQHQLLGIIDSAEIKVILSGLAGDASTHAKQRLQRLTDLSSKQTKHEWLWAINPAHGFVLTPDSFSVGLRLRLGLPLATYPGPLPCAECLQDVLAEDLGVHALSCAKGRRAVGHNKLRDHVASLARIADHCTIIEASGRSVYAGGGPDAPQLRPADILTSAAFLGGVGSVAMDVGIASPHTAEASTNPSVDVLDTYKRRKERKYEAVCSAANWQYKPLMFSAYGRAHDDTVHSIHRLCVAAGKAFGGADIVRTETAWWRNAGTLLVERAARMVERCRPVVALPPELGGRDDDAAVAPRKRRRRQGEAREEEEGGEDLVSGALVAPGDGE
jgi:hypothetical protein